ncbi:FAD-dependent oxidoreductase [Allorhodopirellula solitaria]|uniref:Coenzyme A disulfide reductase n=1 Tax=Allorhodopirellula solitaria TaxID=2527987 RepID=A0A5C5YBD8_9BACT|nr:FAD-dependent oxidoreductase [Allorhodopirellula solitaria]TWT73017.1 Coenzyme A disulfide reductase [Allorhodopirellula solitaria]
MKIVIIGAVAGGASAAARARRLDEDAEIILIERGPEPSFANCGLPYYVGGEIQARDKLLVAPTSLLRQRHRLDVRTRHEVVAIDRDNASVTIKDLQTGEVSTETYDKLIISTGASPFRPPLRGIDHPDVLELRDLDDADQMHARVATDGSSSAVIVGAGFIGIEVAENLARRGIEVTVVELAEQILPPWDAEMVRPLEQHLRDQGVRLKLQNSAESFRDSKTEEGRLVVTLQTGEEIHSSFAVVCIGVRPESGLAAEAGIDCGPRGGIVTNEHMQTSDPNIYAVGDVAQVKDFVTGDPTQIPLAGPANRQGRIAADHIFGRDSTYRGTQGTAVVGVFGKTAAMTGLSEKMLQRSGRSYQKIYIHPNDHAGYYPGATQMTLKLLFDPENGRIWGAQAVGTHGVDKRIDVIAMAIQAGLTVDDLEEVELCYAPQYGSAKDPINMAGFVAAGALRGDHAVVHWSDLEQSTADMSILLDVRTEQEFARGHLPDAINIPLEVLRSQISELPRDRKLVCYCQVGQRGYMATRILQQRGFDAVNLSGGYRLVSQSG